jgi:hypothetical protein
LSEPGLKGLTDLLDLEIQGKSSISSPFLPLALAFYASFHSSLSEPGLKGLKDLLECAVAKLWKRWW